MTCYQPAPAQSEAFGGQQALLGAGTDQRVVLELTFVALADQALVLLYAPDTTVTLSEFIIMVGAAVLILSLIPTLHDVRWLNAFGTLLVFV